MKGNIPISELLATPPTNEQVWLIVSVHSVREGRTRNGKLFIDAVGVNATGRIPLKLWQESYDPAHALRPGLWGVTGKVSLFQEQPQFVVDEYRPIDVEKYREHQNAEPPVARAFTLDIETVALPGYRERVPNILERNARLGKMRIEQIERYAEDPEAEIELAYALGSLAATSGRIISIAVHVGPAAEFELESFESREYVFGIDASGAEQGERDALLGFVGLLSEFDRDADEIVGHNILDFDLPFIFQRCLVHEIPVPRIANFGEFNPRCVYDTMRGWWFGSRRFVGLDDIAWAFGIESSKTDEVEGSRVFDLYQAGRLAEIREYNLNDVRLTRKVYERIVRLYGR